MVRSTEAALQHVRSLLHNVEQIERPVLSIGKYPTEVLVLGLKFKKERKMVLVLPS